MKNINLPLDDLRPYIQKYVNTDENSVITSLCTDSRSIEPGDWFICLKGESHDGHDYINKVLEAGVSGIIYEGSRDVKGIQVENTTDFLGKMASGYLNKIKPCVISITGSNGKTSEKEMIFLLLNEYAPGQVCRTTGNFNNQFGVPYTIFSLKPEDRFLVLEMGTNHPGEIAYLSEIAGAELSVITSISMGHAGNFGSFESIVDEKSDIMKGMKNGGKLFLPSALIQNSIIQEKATKYRIELVFAQDSCRLLENGPEGTRFLYHGREIFLSAAGLHQFENCRLALMVLEEVVRDKEQCLRIAERLSDFKPVKGRLQRVPYPEYNLWDDSYNANPASFREAIRFVQNASGKDFFWGAFGMMGELGVFAHDEHEKLGEVAAKAGMAGVFFSSVDKSLRDAFRSGWEKSGGNNNLMLGENSDEAILAGAKFLSSLMKKGDHLLVKGSRSTKMERIFSFFN